MDGLSGASGVIAVVSVAMQLAGGINKLSEFWKAVQDAPANVERLFDELEILRTVLTHSSYDGLGKDAAEITGRVLKDCNHKVLKLQTKLLGPSLGFASRSFTTRKWAALKVSLRKAEIESLQASIEKAKTTLVISKLNSIERSNNLQFQSQLQILSNISQIIIQSPHYADILPTIPRQSSNDHVRHCNMQIHPEDAGGEDAVPNVLGTPTTESVWITVNPLLLKQWEQQIQNWAMDLATPLWSMRAKYSVSRISTSHSWGVKETTVKDIDYVLYPTRLLQMLGVSYGLCINAKATDGWQYSLRPFHAVPENALIFEFCRNGNVSGVQTLLSLGQASVRDRDPFGRTPLWVAAKSLQVDVAELLIREGADIHVSGWDTKRPPITAICESKEFDVGKKVSMMSVFQRACPDGHEGTQILYLLGLMLLFYRPFKINPMSLSQRRDSALRVVKQLIDHFPRGDKQRSNIVFDMMAFKYDQSVLQWTLQSIEGNIQDDEQNSALHDGFKKKLPQRDPVSMSVIIQKTQNLHRSFQRPEFQEPAVTPTTIALYQPGMFYHWRNTLLELGIDIGEFVCKELEESRLAQEGWDHDMLVAVFRSEAVADSKPPPFGFLRCGRCGRLEEHAGTMIDLPWRRHLRCIRQRCQAELRKSGCLSISNNGNLRMEICYEGSETAAQSELASFEPPVPSGMGLPGGSCSVESPSQEARHWPYKIVCSGACVDGICVAWVYESNLIEEPHLLLYVPKAESKCCDVEEVCPTKGMPGSFQD